jgi:hypothetical protein
MIDAPFVVPLASVITIYVTRLIELGSKRDLVAGKICENLTLPLFFVVGTVIFACIDVRIFIFERRDSGGQPLSRVGSARLLRSPSDGWPSRR